MADNLWQSKKFLQRIGEDTSYTFKGLYKTADWLDISQNSYLILPIILSIICLGFDTILPQIALKIISALSLVGSLVLLIEQNIYKNGRIEKYRILANKYKRIYDKVERKFYEEDYSDIDIIQQEITLLGQEVSMLPISFIGRIWSKRCITSEMNLAWISKE